VYPKPVTQWVPHLQYISNCETLAPIYPSHIPPPPLPSVPARQHLGISTLSTLSTPIHDPAPRPWQRRGGRIQHLDHGNKEADDILASSVPTVAGFTPWLPCSRGCGWKVHARAWAVAAARTEGGGSEAAELGSGVWGDGIGEWCVGRLDWEAVRGAVRLRSIAAKLLLFKSGLHRRRSHRFRAFLDLQVSTAGLFVILAPLQRLYLSLQRKMCHSLGVICKR
jgi:hypothetical protein